MLTINKIALLFICLKSAYSSFYKEQNFNSFYTPRFLGLTYTPISRNAYTNKISAHSTSYAINTANGGNSNAVATSTVSNGNSYIFPSYVNYDEFDDDY